MIFLTKKFNNILIFYFIFKKISTGAVRYRSSIIEYILIKYSTHHREQSQAVLVIVELIIICSYGEKPASKQ